MEFNFFSRILASISPFYISHSADTAIRNIETDFRCRLPGRGEADYFHGKSTSCGLLAKMKRPSRRRGQTRVSHRGGVSPAILRIVVVVVGSLVLAPSQRERERSRKVVVTRARAGIAGLRESVNFSRDKLKSDR